MHCRRCGELNPGDAIFCFNCGFPLPEKPVTVSQSVQEPPIGVNRDTLPRDRARWKHRKIIAVVVAILTVGIAAGIIALHMGSSNATDSHPIAAAIDTATVPPTFTPTTVPTLVPTSTPTTIPTATGTATPTQVSVVTTSSFKIDRIRASEAASFSDVIKLDKQDDGSLWLVVTYDIHNISSDSQTVKSGDITLFVDGQETSDDDNQTKSVADDISAKSMGRFMGASIDSGKDVVVVQVFNVSPTAQVLSLKFDLDTVQYVYLNAYLPESNGSVSAVLPPPTPTAGPTDTPTPTDTPAPTSTPPSYKGQSHDGWVFNVNLAAIEYSWPPANADPKGRWLIVGLTMTNNTGRSASPIDAVTSIYVLDNSQDPPQQWRIAADPSVRTTPTYSGFDLRDKVKKGATVQVGLVFDVPSSGDAEKFHLRLINSPNFDADLKEFIKASGFR